MNKFTSDLVVKSYDETKWELTEEFYFYFSEDDKSTGVTVPKGFITDFASVPRILWSILPPTGRYTKAAVLHDFLYSNASHLELTRKQCDKMFLQGMEILGVKRWVRNTIYRAVRIFGNKYYKKD
jgi:hypothetical protein